jgi:signal transduction histidine kinase
MRLNAHRLSHNASLLVAALPNLIKAAPNAAELMTALNELPELVEDLGLAAEVMQGIVQHLRSFLRPEQGIAQLDPSGDAAIETAVDPLPIIRYASSVCRPIAGRVMGQIIYDGAAQLPRVKMGSTELTQVLINLIANAANALSNEGRVLVTATSAEGCVRFVIADDGAGMPPEVLRKAGTPFFSTRAQGTGLGLSQCHRLLGAIGAKLELESTVDSGTIARFSLPV